MTAPADAWGSAVPDAGEGRTTSGGVTEPWFGILREALTQLSWSADDQCRAFAGSVVTDELALDLDTAWASLSHQSERAGIALAPELTAGLAALLASFVAPPEDTLWDPASLDDHPTWTTARRAAARLLPMVSEADTPPTG